MQEEQIIAATYSLDNGQEVNVHQGVLDKAIKRVKREMVWDLLWAIWCFGWVCEEEYTSAPWFAVLVQSLMGLLFFILALNSWRNFKKAVARQLAFLVLKQLQKEILTKLKSHLRNIAKYVGPLYLFGVIKLDSFECWAYSEAGKKEAADSRWWPLRYLTKVKWQEIEHAENGNNQEATGSTK